jgi:hypothetical protein
VMSIKWYGNHLASACPVFLMWSNNFDFEAKVSLQTLHFKAADLPYFYC